MPLDRGEYVPCVRAVPGVACQSVGQEDGFGDLGAKCRVHILENKAIQKEEGERTAACTVRHTVASLYSCIRYISVEMKVARTARNALSALDVPVALCRRVCQGAEVDALGRQAPTPHNISAAI